MRFSIGQKADFRFALQLGNRNPCADFPKTDMSLMPPLWLTCRTLETDRNRERNWGKLPIVQFIQISAVSDPSVGLGDGLYLRLR